MLFTTAGGERRKLSGEIHVPVVKADKSFGILTYISMIYGKLASLKLGVDEQALVHVRGNQKAKKCNYNVILVFDILGSSLFEVWSRHKLCLYARGHG